MMNEMATCTFCDSPVSLDAMFLTIYGSLFSDHDTLYGDARLFFLSSYYDLITILNGLMTTHDSRPTT